MKNVYVYYECNYGKIAETFGAVSPIIAFSNADKAKRHVTEMLKLYTGNGSRHDPNYYDGCDKFVVCTVLFAHAGIASDSGQLTNEQIDALIGHIFKGGNGCFIPLCAYEQGNLDEYFIIIVDEIEVE